MQPVAKELILIAVCCFLLWYACQPRDKIEETPAKTINKYLPNDNMDKAPKGLWLSIFKNNAQFYKTNLWKINAPDTSLLIWKGNRKSIMMRHSRDIEYYLLPNETTIIPTDTINLYYDSTTQYILNFQEKDTLTYKHIVGLNVITLEEFKSIRKELEFTTWVEYRDSIDYYTISFVDTIRSDVLLNDLFYFNLYIEGDSNRVFSTKDTVGKHLLSFSYPNEYTVLGVFGVDDIVYLRIFDEDNKLVKLYVIEKIEPSQITLIDVYKDEKVIWKKQEGVDIKEAQEKWLKSPFR